MSQLALKPDTTETVSALMRAPDDDEQFLLSTCRDVFRLCNDIDSGNARMTDRAILAAARDRITETLKRSRA